MSSTVMGTAFLIGLAFGDILQRVQVSNPERILGTLTLREPTVLKFMLLGSAWARWGSGDSRRSASLSR